KYLLPIYYAYFFYKSTIELLLNNKSGIDLVVIIVDYAFLFIITSDPIKLNPPLFLGREPP
ncbi:MAG: hypothetical protein KOO64_01085, partial [Desulfobacterales bacterium]|nr:hypothetical protein [Desulfobacterales bacterium]